MTRAAYRCDLTSGVITSLGFPSSLLSRLGIIDLSPKIGKIYTLCVDTLCVEIWEAPNTARKHSPV